MDPSTGRVECAADVALDDRVEWEEVFGHVGPGRSRGSRRLSHRQIKAQWLVAVQNDRTLDQVLELPHVAGPVICEQVIDRARGELGDVPQLEVSCLALDEVLNQCRNVACALP